MTNWILILALVITPVYAAQPLVCPNADIIKQVGLSNHLARDNNGDWYAGRTEQHYGTKEQWTFVIGGIKAPDKQKAILEANEALSSLSFKAGPTKAPSQKWLCLYDNDEGLPSGAVTPPINQLSSFSKFK